MTRAAENAVDLQPHDWKVALAKDAAPKLSARQPSTPARLIVEDLLARLDAKRRRRESIGLNHWEAYGPEYLRRLVARFGSGDRLRRVVRFIGENHDAAVQTAYRITQDHDLAETAASQTYLELLRKKTEIETFFHALKMNARDVVRKHARRTRKLDSLDGLMASALAGQALSPGYVGAEELAPLDFPSSRLEDQDPADVLIARQELRETNDELEHALGVVRCEGNRWLTKKEWWKGSALAEVEKAQRGPISRSRANRKWERLLPGKPSRTDSKGGRE